MYGMPRNSAARPRTIPINVAPSGAAVCVGPSIGTVLFTPSDTAAPALVLPLCAERLHHEPKSRTSALDTPSKLRTSSTMSQTPRARLM